MKLGLHCNISIVFNNSKWKVTPRGSNHYQASTHLFQFYSHICYYTERTVARHFSAFQDAVIQGIKLTTSLRRSIENHINGNKPSCCLPVVFCTYVHICFVTFYALCNLAGEFLFFYFSKEVCNHTNKWRHTQKNIMKKKWRIVREKIRKKR